MNEPQKSKDQPDTADMYHFRSKADLIVFCIFIVAVLALITWLAINGVPRV